MTREGRLLASGERMVPHHKTVEEMDAEEARIAAAIAAADAAGEVVRCRPTPPPLRSLGRVPRAER
jgi:hypothetical protein